MSAIKLTENEEKSIRDKYEKLKEKANKPGRDEKGELSGKPSSASLPKPTMLKIASLLRNCRIEILNEIEKAISNQDVIEEDILAGNLPEKNKLTIAIEVSQEINLLRELYLLWVNKAETIGYGERKRDLLGTDDGVWAYSLMSGINNKMKEYKAVGELMENLGLDKADNS